MPSTARGNLGEVIGPNSPSSPPEKISPLSSLPPFRPRPIAVPRKPPSKTSRRLQFITLPHCRPPHSPRAACARFRLARKKLSCPQFDNATLAALEQLEARMCRFLSKLQTETRPINDVLDATQKIPLHAVIHTLHLASSSFSPSSVPNSTQHLVRIYQAGLATHSTVAPLETCSRALSPPFGPIPEDAIT